MNKQHEVTVGSMPVSSSKLRQRVHLKSFHLSAINKRSFAIFGLALITVGLTITTLVYLRRAQPVETMIENEATVVASEYRKLKEQGPPKTAVPEDVIAYYDTLATRAADTANYKDAVTAFERRKEISPKSMDYRDYFTGAKYYCKSGDKAKADESLRASASLLPAQDDYDKGFYRDTMLAEIEFLRKECAL